jgi:hypothetical protein
VVVQWLHVGRSGENEAIEKNFARCCECGTPCATIYGVPSEPNRTGEYHEFRTHQKLDHIDPP